MKTYEASLSPLERIVLITLLPQQGAYSLLKHAEGVRAALDFSIEESEAWSIVRTETKTSWDPKAAQDTTVWLGESIWDSVADKLRQKSASSSLEPQEVTLYEKLVLAGE